MLNQVHVEGYVTKRIWQHSGDTFFRLAVYRDPDRPRKEATGRQDAGERDQPDYVTICIPASLTTLPVAFRTGQRVQVYGWLESREFDYTLGEFLEDAQGPRLETDPRLRESIVAHRGTTWIVADRVVTIDGRRRH